MDGGTIESVIERMEVLLEPMQADGDPRRHFLATYRRTTIAVHKALLADHFVDGAWVERWDVVFASLYLDALEQWNRGDATPGPWAVAFDSATDRRVPPLRQVLLGMNAHINYDLPQALLAVITDDEFVDSAVVARRNVDHERIDAILSSRVDAEDLELQRVETPGDRTRLDRMLKPFNQAATKRFMKESRRKVWRNAVALSIARRRGPAVLGARLSELEDLSRRRVEDLRIPGQVLIKLAIRGFGVELPAAMDRPDPAA
ncbi:MAG: DUF5995 family protein [Ilumatobacteraceae bacterium]